MVTYKTLSLTDQQHLNVLAVQRIAWNDEDPSNRHIATRLIRDFHAIDAAPFGIDVQGFVEIMREMVKFLQDWSGETSAEAHANANPVYMTGEPEPEPEPESVESFYSLPARYAVQMRRNARRDPETNWNGGYFANVVCEHMTRDTASQAHNWAWMRDYV
jgi:hypothetical protein